MTDCALSKEDPAGPAKVAGGGSTTLSLSKTTRHPAGHDSAESHKKQLCGGNVYPISRASLTFCKRVASPGKTNVFPTAARASSRTM